jgi:prepilin signal peptidase PulO-like enzyme (type II secretory pathway)
MATDRVPADLVSKLTRHFLFHPVSECRTGALMSKMTTRQIAWIAGAVTPVLTCWLGVTVTWQWLLYPLGTGCGLTLVTLLLVTVFTDGYWKKIPNWATYPAFAWLLVFNLVGTLWAATPDAATGMEQANGWPVVGPPPLGAIGIGGCLLGALACFAVMVVLSGWLRSSGGDVKLVTVIGACLGIRYGLLAMCLGYILAGCFSLILCIWHYGFLNIVKGVFAWIGNLFLPLVIAKPHIRDDRLLKTGVPLGAHFALGTLLALTPIIPGIQY